MNQSWQYLGKILGDDDETIIAVPVKETKRQTLTIREWYEENERTPFYDEIAEGFEVASEKADEIIARVNRLCEPATPKSYRSTSWPATALARTEGRG